MVVGSIIATGKERGGEGGGGKEDIHVLLTEWRRKTKKKRKKKRMQGQKDRGMETNPLHASGTGVSVAGRSLRMLINNTFHPPVALDLHGLLLRQKLEGGTWELGPVKKP